MPIIEPPRPDSPLSQGDILRDIPFFLTQTPWKEGSGKPAKAPFNLCLVLSRTCVVAHKENAIVAAIDQLKGALPKGIDSFDKMLSLLTGVRDGRSSPDMFYLGQLPGRTGRHAARFDSLHTIEIPQSEEERRTFLAHHRIGTLNIEFCRDLHLRLFAAFASLGFDDHCWFSTDDLQALVDQGRADLAALDRDLAQKRAARSAFAAEGQQLPDRDMETAQRKCEELKERLAPYEQELSSRTSRDNGA
jgi:hypothetical protein